MPLVKGNPLKSLMRNEVKNVEERTDAILVRLTLKEKAHLKKQSEIAGLKMEPFIRKLIMGTELHPRPPDEYRKVLYHLSAIGNSINQIAHHANRQKYVSAVQINEAVTLIDEAISAVKRWE